MNLCVCVCVYVSGCDRDLFEETLQMRERRLELEELLAEKKKSAEALKTECDTLAKKVVLLFSLSSHFNIHVYVTMRSFCTTSYCVCVCVCVVGGGFLGSAEEIFEEQVEGSQGQLGQR